MSSSAVRNMRTSEGNIFHLIPYLNYLETPLQVLLFSSYGNVTSHIYFNYVDLDLYFLHNHSNFMEI